MKKILLALTLVSVISLPAINAEAANPDKAARRAQIMMQKMKQDLQAQSTQEKAKMQSDFDAEKAELEAIIDEQKSKIRRLNGVKRKSRQLASDKAALSQAKQELEVKQTQTLSALEKANAKISQLSKELSQNQALLKTNEQQRKTQLRNLSQTTKSLSACEAKNEKLYLYGKELINFYESPKAVKAVKDKKGFFQSKTVILENLLQDQNDLLDAERLQSN